MNRENREEYQYNLDWLIGKGEIESWRFLERFLASIVTRAAKTGRAIWAGPKARIKRKAWAKKLEPEFFQGFLARPVKARNPFGLQAARQPAKNSSGFFCVVYVYYFLDSPSGFFFIVFKFLHQLLSCYLLYCSLSEFFFFTPLLLWTFCEISSKLCSLVFCSDEIPFILNFILKIK